MKESAEFVNWVYELIQLKSKLLQEDNNVVRTQY